MVESADYDCIVDEGISDVSVIWYSEVMFIGVPFEVDSTTLIVNFIEHHLSFSMPTDMYVIIMTKPHLGSKCNYYLRPSGKSQFLPLDRMTPTLLQLGMWGRPIQRGFGVMARA